MPAYWDDRVREPPADEVASHAVGAAKEGMALVAEEGLLDPRVRRMMLRVAANRGLGGRPTSGEPGRQRPQRPNRERGRRGRGRPAPGRGTDGGRDEEH
jgi:hypothetical protein